MKDPVRDYPPVSIVVLNYNGLKFLGEGLVECLQSIFETKYPNFKILFIDNGSTDGSAKFIRKSFKDPRLTIIENRSNLGYAEGNNVGISASNGKYVALLNNDVVVNPNWLRETIEVMESCPQVGIAGCKIMVYGTLDKIDYVGAKLSMNGEGILIGHGEKDGGQYNSVRNDFDFVIGAAIIIKREVFDKIGLLDPGYFLLYEETDFCYRAHNVGYEIIYVPNAVVWHRSSATFKGLDPSGLYRLFMLYRQRIRFILINFNLLKIFRALLFDLIGFLSPRNLLLQSKLLLLKAYWWNAKHLTLSLRRRFTIQRRSRKLIFPE